MRQFTTSVTRLRRITNIVYWFPLLLVVGGPCQFVKTPYFATLPQTYLYWCGTGVMPVTFRTTQHLYSPSNLCCPRPPRIGLLPTARIAAFRPPGSAPDSRDHDLPAAPRCQPAAFCLHPPCSTALGATSVPPFHCACVLRADNTGVPVPSGELGCSLASTPFMPDVPRQRGLFRPFPAFALPVVATPGLFAYYIWFASYSLKRLPLFR